VAAVHELRARLALALLLLGLCAGSAHAQPPELLAARGIARYQAGDLRGAVELLRRALAGAPEHTAAAHHLGLALIRSGQLSEGRRVLAAAARHAPEDAARLVYLGQAYLRAGNAAGAVRVLGRAAEIDRGNARARYLHGVALLKLGEPESAAQALARARGPEVDSSEAALRLALAYYLTRRYRESRPALGPALSGPDRGTARRLLRASLSAEGQPAALLSAELSLAGLVDTNPLYEAETTSPPAVGPSLAGALVFRPLVTSHHTLWGEVSGARSFYFPAGSEPAPAPGSGPAPNTVGDASPSEVRAAAFYSYRADGEPALEISGGYSFDLVFLDAAAPASPAARKPNDPPPLADAHHIFLEQHTGQVALRRFKAGFGYSLLRYNLVRSAFADLARSNWGNELALEQGLNLFGERLRLLAWVNARYEAAQTVDYNQVAAGAGAGGSYLGPLELVVGLRLGYEYRNHFDSAGSARFGGQRVDNNLAFTVEVGRALPWSLRLRAVYQRLQNFSTAESYDYSRDLVTLGVSWSSQ
jgi:Flp pilus assembly protein TadD